jgi:hypothetical protein
LPQMKKTLTLYDVALTRYIFQSTLTTTAIFYANILNQMQLLYLALEMPVL